MLITIMISLLTLLTPIFINAENKTSTDSIKLTKIDLSNDSVLYNVIRDIVTDDKAGDDGLVYILTNSFKNGTFIHAVKTSEKKILSYQYSDWSGYLTVSGHTIICRINNSNKKYGNLQEIMSFGKDERRFSQYNYVKEWYYYILDDIYARFDSEKGWIWSDGKPDE
ncbi:MAG: hypothetical protein J5995_04460 [Muribaculaceae bacterium]|nr:hypothetical protein [Muribaculaceae bacterium]